MEVKRIPQSAVSQTVDPSGATSHQEHQGRDKGKKNPKKPSSEPGDASSETQSNAQWQDAELSHQTLDSEKVAELLNQPPPNTVTNHPYKAPAAPAKRPKLDQKY